PSIPQLAQRVLVQGGGNAQDHVRRWADRQGNVPFREFDKKSRVIDCSHTMHDPLRIQRVNGSANGLGACVFAGMRHRVEAPMGSLGEERRERLGRVALLGSTKSDPDDVRHPFGALQKCVTYLNWKGARYV